MTDSSGSSEPVSLYGDPAPARGPRRRLHPDDRKRALMLAALRLFRERSYDQVSVDDIAAAADMSRPLFAAMSGFGRPSATSRATVSSARTRTSWSSSGPETI